MGSRTGSRAQTWLQKTLLLLSFLLFVRAGLVADAERWVPDSLIESAYRDYGDKAGDLIKDWRAALHRLSDEEEQKKLAGVNRFINKAGGTVMDPCAGSGYVNELLMKELFQSQCNLPPL